MWEDYVISNVMIKLKSRESKPGGEAMVLSQLLVIGELRPKLIMDMGIGLVRTRKDQVTLAGEQGTMKFDG